MERVRISRSEVEVLRRLFDGGPISISLLADKIGKSKSRTSKIVKDLSYKGLLAIRMRGRMKEVSISTAPPGSSLSTMLEGISTMNLWLLIGGYGLELLIILSARHRSLKDIVQRTGISERTIHEILGRWRKIGVVVLKKRLYGPNRRHSLIIVFAREYSVHRILGHISKNLPGGVLVWHGGDEYIVSLARPVGNADGFTTAADTRLFELGYNIVSRRIYYYHGPSEGQTSELEALVQSIKVNPGNPRPVSNIKRAMEEKNFDRDEAIGLMHKYRLASELKKVIH